MTPEQLHRTITAIARLVVKNDAFGVPKSEVTKSAYAISRQGTLIIEHLINIEAIIVHDEYVFLNYNNELTYSARRTYDLSRLYANSPNTVNDVIATKRQLLSGEFGKVNAIFLVGSHSRNTATTRSDLDFLVISSKKGGKASLQTLRKIDIIHYETQFAPIALEQCDEFLLWAFKYGVLLYDDNFFAALCPRHQVDLFLPVRRKKAAIEKTLYSISLASDEKNRHGLADKILRLEEQIYRLAIMQSGKLPKSSRELKDQFIRHFRQASSEPPKTAGSLGERKRLLEHLIRLKDFYLNVLRNQ